ncbi:YveK family protein [Ructibacterium gallinarum]|uniref:Polysaccharide chain length determinant N-terminal domain-containing protein n=1 Tax=Ructibacterium gallinarum TaxID=2779355 RepID=A0A9D5M4Q7_9FIRM|nr:Wzz/FepE/Etk N-terminal domain-containing protein [Ructibacterium gallinarum]MBE5039514.1 hypothetical protein [Ructibacterium gallinarum]
MNEEFSINSILSILLPKWPVIFLSTVALGMAALLISLFLIQPVYVAGGTLYITGDVTAVSGAVKQNTNLSDLMLSQELAKTYGQILSSNTFFKTVAQESNTNYTYEQIQRLTSISNVEETGLLAISVSHTKPQVACDLANTILRLAPSEIERIVVGGSAVIIDPAELPEAPASPNIPKNTVIGAFAGLILSVLIIFLRDMFDHSIKTADDIENSFSLPILGMIPAMESRKVRGITVK